MRPDAALRRALAVTSGRGWPAVRPLTSDRPLLAGLSRPLRALGAAGPADRFEQPGLDAVLARTLAAEGSAVEGSGVDGSWVNGSDPRPADGSRAGAGRPSGPATRTRSLASPHGYERPIGHGPPFTGPAPDRRAAAPTPGKSGARTSGIVSGLESRPGAAPRGLAPEAPAAGVRPVAGPAGAAPTERRPEGPPATSDATVPARVGGSGGSTGATPQAGDGWRGSPREADLLPEGPGRDERLWEGGGAAPRPVPPGELGRLVSLWEGFHGEAASASPPPTAPDSGVVAHPGGGAAAGRTVPDGGYAVDGLGGLPPVARAFPVQDLEAVLDEVLLREAERYGLEEGVS